MIRKNMTRQETLVQEQGQDMRKQGKYMTRQNKPGKSRTSKWQPKPSRDIKGYDKKGQERARRLDKTGQDKTRRKDKTGRGKTGQRAHDKAW